MTRVRGAERKAVESRVVLRRWRELVAAWKRSGQEEGLFCERQKIGVCALRWWVRRLAGDDHVGSAASPAGLNRERVVAKAAGLRRGHSREQWAQHCADWETSGLRQAEFCRERGLNVETLRWWRSRLRAHAASGIRRRPPVDMAASSTTTPAPTFVPVTITAAPHARIRPRRPTIDVVLRGRRRVRIGPDLDERLLARVVLVLEAIP